MFKNIKVSTFLIIVIPIFQVFSLQETHYVNISNGELHRLDGMVCSCVHKNGSQLHMKYVPPVQHVHYLSKRSAKLDKNEAVQLDMQRYFQQLVADVQRQIDDYADNAMVSLQQLESDKNRHHHRSHASKDQKTVAEIRKNERLADAKIQEVSNKVVNIVSDEVDEFAKAASEIIKFVEQKIDHFRKNVRFNDHK